jgi:hypothetical protein
VVGHGGAHRPSLLRRAQEFTEFRGDRQPVALTRGRPRRSRGRSRPHSHPRRRSRRPVPR